MVAYVIDFKDTHNCAVIESTMLGQEVLVMDHLEAPISIDVAALQGGIYLLNAYSGDSRQTVRVIISN